MLKKIFPFSLLILVFLLIIPEIDVQANKMLNKNVLNNINGLENDIQTRKIKQQEIVLQEHKKLITLHQNISIFLLTLVVVLLCSLYFIYRSKIKQERKTKQLELTNKEIETASKLLQRQNKELEQFAYIASHDLQEPLHTITSFTNFMIEDYKNEIDESGEQYLNYIKQGCERMSNLILALLEYSKIGVEKSTVDIDTKQLLITVKNDFSSLIEKSNAEIIINEIPNIEGYEVELRLLFQNLISNGIKFRKSKGQVKIEISGKKLASTHEYLDRWQFSVKDNGIGIAREHHHKIFDIFKRLHNREEYEGTGIGLAHCEKIVALHNGTIWLYSKPNEGATFYFTVQSNKKNSIKKVS